MVGTTRGVVKRVSLGDLGEKTHYSLIALKGSDHVAGASLAPDNHHIVLVTSAGQLLTFSASDVRPQGLAASGVAGISLPEDDRVIFAAAVNRETADVITISGSTAVLPGTESARVKRSVLKDFPTKGRATSGVRAHSFLKGEDVLVGAFVGTYPRALGARGQAMELPDEVSKRDGSGSLVEGSYAALGVQLF
jgi:DNA gyrase subunit A